MSQKSASNDENHIPPCDLLCVGFPLQLPCSTDRGEPCHVRSALHEHGYFEQARKEYEVALRSTGETAHIMGRQKATYSSRRGSLLTPSGFKSYGMISHNFLKHHSWTIDFLRRRFPFH